MSQYPPLPVPVLAVPEIAAAARDWRAEGAVIVLAAGCFDPLHLGHVEHLAAAKRLGNVLVVSVAGDALVRATKGKAGGPARPFMPAAHRAGIVAGLRGVDGVVVCETDDATEIVRALRPHVYAKGTDYHPDRLPPALAAERALVESYGGRMAFVSGASVASSSALLAGAVASAVPAGV